MRNHTAPFAMVFLATLVGLAGCSGTPRNPCDSNHAADPECVAGSAGLDAGATNQGERGKESKGNDGTNVDAGPGSTPNQTDAGKANTQNQADDGKTNTANQTDAGKANNPSQTDAGKANNPSQADAAANGNTMTDDLSSRDGGTVDPESPDGSSTDTTDIDEPEQTTPIGALQGNASGEAAWANGYVRVATAGVTVSGQVEYSIAVSVSAKLVPQEELISFIQNHRSLFTDEQYQKLTTHASYLERGKGAKLLLGMLGLVFGQDIDYFRANPKAPIVAQTQQQKDFIAALSELHEKPFTMKGQVTGVSNSPIPSSAQVYTEITRVRLPDGSSLRVIDTGVRVTDQTGGSNTTAKANQRPLGLFSSDGSTQALQLTHSYGKVAQSDAALQEGQQVTLEVNKTVTCVAHERLAAFVTEHKALFSDTEYQTITGATAFGDATQATDLLVGMLGVKLGSSWGYFTGASSLEIAAYDQGDKDFVTALSQVQDQEYTLSGSHTVVGVGNFGAKPVVAVPVARIVLPGGSSLRAIGTVAIGLAQDGTRRGVQSQSNASPLQLVAR